MQHVANRPIVCHAVQALRAAAVTQIAVATPSAHEQTIRRCIEAETSREVDVRYMTYDEGRGAGEAVRSAAEHVGDASCIVHLADGLLRQPLAPFAEPLERDSTDLLLLVHQGARPGERLGTAARRLLHIADLDPVTSSLGLAGVCLFGLGALRRAVDGVELAADGTDLIAMADEIAISGGRMDVQVVRGWRHYGGRIADLLELNRSTLELLPDVECPTLADNHIEGRVVIDPTAQVTSSVIIGPVVIGPAARIDHAYIGPYTSVGSGARIEGAEIEQSIISCDAQVVHVEGRLVSSFIGQRSRIHRDFSLPRALRIRVGESVEVALP